MEDILQRIPHRPPFLFIDRVLETTDQGLVAEKTWNADAAFYAGHYPGNPITPGVLLCESVFQAGAVYMAHKLESEGGSLDDATPVLSRIQEAKFKNMVRPGERCRIEVAFKEKMSVFTFMTGKVTNEAGKLVLTLTYALAMVEEKGGAA